MNATNAISARPPCAVLRRIAVDDRNDLAVTYIAGEDGKPIPLSVYQSNLWDFSPYVLNKNTSSTYVNFDYQLSDEVSITDDAESSLRIAAKSFIYTRWLAKSPRSTKHIKAATLISCWMNLKSLLRWMYAQSITGFDELTPARCAEYASYVSADESVKQRQKVAQLEILELIYAFRGHLPKPMNEHPWPEDTAFTLTGARRTDGMYDVRTEIIPKRLYADLGRKSIEFIEHESERILNIWNTFHSFYLNEIELAGYHAKARMKAGAKASYQTLETVSYDIARGRALSKIQPLLDLNGLRFLTDLDDEVRLLRTCCYTVVAMFSGMRDSEIVSLRDNCFERSFDMDGEEYCWVHGLTYKLEEQPKPAKWMVPPVVEKAVNVAAELRRSLLPYIGKRRFYLSEVAKDEGLKSKIINDATLLESSLFLGWKALGTRPEFLQNVQTNTMLKKVAERFELVVSSNDLDEVIDRAAITPEKLWPLATHQFRRTFAVFVARNVLGDVRYLRHHFKHWSMDMTLHYAKDPLFDDSLFESVLSKRDELQVSIISGWLAPHQNLSGGRADHIVRFRGRSEVKTAKDPKALVKAVGEGIFIRGTGHSWCLATTKGCGGEGLYDAIRCAGCGEGVIDQGHLIIWRRIREQQAEVLSWPDLGDPAWERATTHLREAERVLGELGNPVEPYLLPERPSLLIPAVEAI
jgi:integrase